ncbi:MAG: hypothetical protein AAF497_12045, partial [Planctomycetota bacterium]
MKISTCIPVLVVLFLSSAAPAAFVTRNEAGMDTIYSQQALLDVGMPIDIRFIGSAVIEDESLLVVDGVAELNSLLLNPVMLPPPIANFTFVDSIQWCGAPAQPPNSFSGCGTTPGNFVVFTSSFLATPLGFTTSAHELAHNLGLQHVNDPTNLMFPAANGGTTLTAGQVDTILTSPLIQTDTDGSKFIEI